MSSLQGQLLIATQDLLDPNFARTVVLIAVHGEDGALGLIVNREMGMSLRHVWEQVSRTPCVRKGNVRQGGPVTGTLMALHDQRPLANLVVADDIYVATEIGAMESLVADDEGRAIFYAGHSGWGPGQLEKELEEGSWLILPAIPEFVFGPLDPLSAWKKATLEFGRRQIRSILPIRDVPEDPRLN